MAIVGFIQRRGALCAFVSVFFRCVHVPMCVAQYKPSFRQTLVRLQRWPAATWSALTEHWSLRQPHATAVWRGVSYRRHQHGKLGLASRSAKTGRQHRGDNGETGVGEVAGPEDEDRGGGARCAGGDRGWLPLTARIWLPFLSPASSRRAKRTAAVRFVQLDLWRSGAEDALQN